MPKKKLKDSFELWYLTRPSTHDYVFSNLNPKLQYQPDPKAAAVRHNFSLYDTKEQLMEDFLNWTLREHQQEAYFGKITVSCGQKVRLKALMDICEELPD